MPTALALSWLEARMEAERVLADKAILTVLAPHGRAPVRRDDPALVPAHG
jgi:biopolymer transport protein ExbB